MELVLARYLTWYHTTPECTVRSSGTTIAFHSMLSLKPDFQSQLCGPSHVASPCGLVQCSTGVPPTNVEISPTGTLVGMAL